MHSLHYIALPSLHFIQYIAFITLHYLHCISYMALITMHSLHCITYIALTTLHSLHCIHYTVFIILHSLHCIHYIAFITLQSLHCIHYFIESSSSPTDRQTDIVPYRAATTAKKYVRLGFNFLFRLFFSWGLLVRIHADPPVPVYTILWLVPQKV